MQWGGVESSDHEMFTGNLIFRFISVDWINYSVFRSSFSATFPNRSGDDDDVDDDDGCWVFAWLPSV